MIVGPSCSSWAKRRWNDDVGRGINLNVHLSCWQKCKGEFKIPT